MSTTIVDGNASVNVSSLPVGEYLVNITYMENEKYNATVFTDIGNVTVTDKNSTPINLENLVLDYGVNIVINATLPTDLNGENVTVVIVGKNSTNATINPSGNVSVEFGNLSAGVYEIRVIFSYMLDKIVLVHG